MALTATLTLTAATTGRMPGCFSQAPSAGALIRINSGAVALMPLPTSGFSCYALSCLGTKGTGNGKGMIGVPQSSGGQGTISFAAGGSILALGAVSVVRTAGSTEVAAGGGTN